MSTYEGERVVRLWAPLRAAGAFLALCAMAAVLPLSGGAQTLRGLLLERYTETPITLGRVVLMTEGGEAVGETLTDENGFFSLSADEGGRFFLVASALGYRTARSERVEVGDGVQRVGMVHLDVRPLPVEGVIVEGSVDDEVEVPELIARGFYDRMREGRGEFLTPAAIARHSGTYTPQLFREMISVELVASADPPIGPWNDEVMIRSNRMGSTLSARICRPAIWVDDVPLELMPGESLDDLVPKSDLEGVEVYIAPFGPPLRYFRDNSMEACGAVLLWTDRR